MHEATAKKESGSQMTLPLDVERVAKNTEIVVAFTTTARQVLAESSKTAGKHKGCSRK
jgi:hypothetical protein